MRPIEIEGAELPESPERPPVRPTLLTWNRIEPLPVSTDLEPGLAAGVADPLWMLARQWQFLEFAGEDAGTPIDVRIAGDIALLGRYAAGPPGPESAARAVAMDAGTLPLETIVEREPLRAQHLRAVAEAGQHLVRLLEAARLTAVRDAYRTAFPLDLGAAALTTGDDDGAEWVAVAKGRAVDARAVHRALAPHRDSSGALTTLPATPAVAEADRTKTRAALARWLAWYAESVVEGSVVEGSADAWNPRRQEYAFAVGARLGQQEVVLTADEYADGELDWYSVRASTLSLNTPTTPAAPTTRLTPTMPAPVDYPGKPADRYWEFEDGRVQFGSLSAGPTDLGRLLLVEFALVYGNDWWLVPARLPVGSLFHVTAFEVRDTFGVVTRVPRATNQTGAAWSLFELAEAEPGASRASRRDLFFLPPTLASRLEGDPIEEVVLFRDEMANMAWGAERRVPGVSGDGYDRRAEHDQRARVQALSEPLADTTIAYRLATSVPEYWIPFVPVPAEGTNPGVNPVIQLERRTIVRTEPNGERRAIHPKGLLLRSEPARPPAEERPLRLEEEEVPRDGAIVERTLQFARWFDGRTLLWLGRRKRRGRGEGSSGLAYDVLTKVARPSS